MSKFVNFSLHWQEYGSYPERDTPFGLPSHITLLATEKWATACTVFAVPRGAQGIEWNAKWKQLDIAHVDMCRRVLSEINAFGEVARLTDPNATGTYLISWLIVGIDNGRKLGASVEFFAPENNLNALGSRLRSAMMAIRNAVA